MNRAAARHHGGNDDSTDSEGAARAAHHRPTGSAPSNGATHPRRPAIGYVRDPESARAFREYSSKKNEFTKVQDDYGFLCSRVQRLIIEEGHMRREIALVREQLGDMTEARAQHLASLKAWNDAKEQSAAEIAARREKIQVLKKEFAENRATKLEKLKGLRRQTVTKLRQAETTWLTMTKEEKQKEAAKNAAWRKAIYGREVRAVQRRQDTLKRREEAVRESNKKGTEQLETEKQSLVEASSRVALAEAGLMRSMAALRNEHAEAVKELTKRVETIRSEAAQKRRQSPQSVSPHRGGGVGGARERSPPTSARDSRRSRQPGQPLSKRGSSAASLDEGGDGDDPDEEPVSGGASPYRPFATQDDDDDEDAAADGRPSRSRGGQPPAFAPRPPPARR